MVNLGRIVNVDVKDVWSHEAQDFTPWLAANLDILGEELGLDLELDDIEVPVGGFSLDILARDANNNHAAVAIENQIAGTDHTHLGQLLTYAAGTEAGTVIWVATNFRDEHRAALDWLNQHTDEDTNFFGVEISAIRIGDSSPAPLFRLASVPNSWSKQVKSTPKNGMTERQQRYAQFWKPLLEQLNDSRGWNVKTENSASYYDSGSGLGTGFGRFGRTMRFTNDGKARVELHFAGPSKEWNEEAFDLLHEHKDNIEKELGEELNWDRLEHAKGCRVEMRRTGSIEDSADDLDEIRGWMIENISRFPIVFKPYLEEVLSKVD